MSIPPLMTNHVTPPSNRTEQLFPSQNSSPGTDALQKSTDSITIDRQGRGQSDYDAIQNGKASLASLARTIHSADSAMAAIGQHIDVMRVKLEAIVKNYPPFPPGSEDRVRLLKSFNSIRQLIDSLSMPSLPDGAKAQKIMADPAAVPGAGDVQISLGDGVDVRINAQQVHTGPTGLNIPALPDVPGSDASDAEVGAAIANLDNAQITLNGRRAGLAADAAVLQKSGEVLPAFAQAKSTFAEIIGTTFALEKSVGVKQDLGRIGNSGITGSTIQNTSL